jgi:AsmA family protein
VRAWVHESLSKRPWLLWTGAIFLALVLLATGLVVSLDAGYFRGPALRFLAARSERQVQVGGVFKLHLFSRNPRLDAEGVVIGNPPWTTAGITAEIAHVSMAIELPGWKHGFGIAKLEMQGAKLHLARDSSGHANWQWRDPDKQAGHGLPIIHGLEMQDAHVELDDALRHLAFNGTVSAQDRDGAAEAHSVQIEGAGQLNGRPATFAITGDPLAAASHDKPYHFSFSEQSSGSRLTGRGILLRPFDFDKLDTTFDAAGEDMKDLYFLTGVTLINTGSYRLSGKLARRGTNSVFSELNATSGQSDVRGTLSIDSSNSRPKLDADLNSQRVRTLDFGLRAAARQPTDPAARPLVLSDAMISPQAVRHGDATVNFRAHRLDIGRVSLHTVEAKMTINHGVVVVSPLSAEIFQGKLSGNIRLDARKEIPAAAVDLKIANLQLAQIDPAETGQPPLEGSLQARVMITGEGRSIHQVAASADGTLTAIVPEGAIRKSLAELAGVELAGLGRLAAKNKQETAIRCGVASFHAHEGTLTAQSLVLDTEPTLVTGEGDIHLDSEALDLTLHGHPKGLVLLRLRTPVMVRGTLTHPLLEVKAGGTAAQAAEAVALGVILTPLAAVLAFVDPGLTKDADCAALLAAAKALTPKT